MLSSRALSQRPESDQEITYVDENNDMSNINQDDELSLTNPQDKTDKPDETCNRDESVILHSGSESSDDNNLETFLETHRSTSNSRSNKKNNDSCKTDDDYQRFLSRSPAEQEIFKGLDTPDSDEFNPLQLLCAVFGSKWWNNPRLNKGNGLNMTAAKLAWTSGIWNLSGLEAVYLYDTCCFLRFNDITRSKPITRAMLSKKSSSLHKKVFQDAIEAFSKAKSNGTIRSSEYYVSDNSNKNRSRFSKSVARSLKGAKKTPKNEASKKADKRHKFLYGDTSDHDNDNRDSDSSGSSILANTAFFSHSSKDNNNNNCVPTPNFVTLDDIVEEEKNGDPQTAVISDNDGDRPPNPVTTSSPIATASSNEDKPAQTSDGSTISLFDDNSPPNDQSLPILTPSDVSTSTTDPSKPSTPTAKSKSSPPPKTCTESQTSRGEPIARPDASHSSQTKQPSTADEMITDMIQQQKTPKKKRVLKICKSTPSNGTSDTTSHDSIDSKKSTSSNKTKRPNDDNSKPVKRKKPENPFVHNESTLLNTCTMTVESQIEHRDPIPDMLKPILVNGKLPQVEDPSAPWHGNFDCIPEIEANRRSCELGEHLNRMSDRIEAKEILLKKVRHQERRLESLEKREYNKAIGQLIVDASNKLSYYQEKIITIETKLEMMAKEAGATGGFKLPEITEDNYDDFVRTVWYLKRNARRLYLEQCKEEIKKREEVESDPYLRMCKRKGYLRERKHLKEIRKLRLERKVYVQSGSSDSEYEDDYYSETDIEKVD